MRFILVVVLILASLWVLERPRAGVVVAETMIGQTPVTRYARADSRGPVIVIAHGFAGSSEMMQGYALPLAAAGYQVYAFDFLGHGRHRLPMSGDVNAIEGTTRLLVEQTAEVIDAVSGDGVQVGLLGHSMATDILVRVAKDNAGVGPIVLLSAFSQEVTAEHPENMLLLVGAWEPGLREFALDAAQMVRADASFGVTVTADQIVRRAVSLPMIEHVSILQSMAGQSEALAWFNSAFERADNPTIWPMGPAMVTLFAGIVLLFARLARGLPERHVAPAQLDRRQLAFVLLLPLIATPPVAVFANPGLMPVLVADYLALHLLIYGALQLGLLTLWRVPLGAFSVAGFVLLGLGCVAFVFAIDRYAANFWPTGTRVGIIGLITLGATLFFVADARLSHLASRRRRVLIHLAFLLSLVVAVMIDFAGLFFLLMIAPVIVLFYLVFGTMGHAVSNRTGPVAVGIVLGLMLAWSLGVTFPLFQG